LDRTSRAVVARLDLMSDTFNSRLSHQLDDDTGSDQMVSEVSGARSRRVVIAEERRAGTDAHPELVDGELALGAATADPVVEPAAGTMSAPAQPKAVMMTVRRRVNVPPWIGVWK